MATPAEPHWRTETTQTAPTHRTETTTTVSTTATTTETTRLHQEETLAIAPAEAPITAEAPIWLCTVQPAVPGTVPEVVQGMLGLTDRETGVEEVQEMLVETWDEGMCAVAVQSLLVAADPGRQ